MKKREKALYLVSGLLILFDFVVVLLLSILSVGFKTDEIKNPIFWVGVAINQFAVLVAYFGTIGLGKNEESKCDDVIGLIDDVNSKLKDIDITYLSTDLSEYIKIENCKMRCWEYSQILNKQLQNGKLTNDERTKIIEEKNLVLQWHNYYNDLNSKQEAIKPEIDFDINAKKVKNAVMIVENSFVSESDYEENKQIGSIQETKVIAKDAVFKISVSVVMTVLFSTLRPDTFKSGYQAVYEVMWRLFLIAFNVWSGFQEGKKIIRIHKVNAFKEKQKILTMFFNKMFIIGKIQKG